MYQPNDVDVRPKLLRQVKPNYSRQAAAAHGLRVESLGFGQAPAGPHIWAWQPFRMTSIVMPNMTPAVAAAAAQSYDSGRVWIFQATAGDYGFTIFCIATIPRGLSDSERGTLVSNHAAIVGEIMRRMSISVVP